MRPHLAVPLLLASLAVAASAQTARQEKAIDLPAGVSVELASISRAGKLVAAIGSDRAVRVWSVRELLRTIAEGKELGAVQFSEDERLLAVDYEVVKYEKGEMKIFDVDSWKVRHDFAGGPPVEWLAFSPDSRHLAGAGDFVTYVWDLPARKKATISPPFGGSASLAFSPDGAWVATADGDTFVRVYDASTGALHSATQVALLEPMTVAFSPDGKTLLEGGVDKTISFIEVASENSDPTAHNIHPLPTNNREWNQSQAQGVPPIETSFGREEIAIPVKCNIHPWMKGYIAVFKHPYFAATGKDGQFVLKNLPPGNYTITAWHEQLGASSQKVTIGANETKDVSFVFEAHQNP